MATYILPPPCFPYVTGTRSGLFDLPDLGRGRVEHP
jgi:hypothetical protein